MYIFVIASLLQFSYKLTFNPKTINGFALSSIPYSRQIYFRLDKHIDKCDVM